MRLLFLDDDEARHIAMRPMVAGHDYTAVYTAADAIKALEGERFDVAFLDHDLGGRVYVDSSEEETGHTVAKHIAAMPVGRWPKRIVIHSFNPIGALEMHRTLRAAGHTDVTRAMFGRWTVEPGEADRRANTDWYRRQVGK